MHEDNEHETTRAPLPEREERSLTQVTAEAIAAASVDVQGADGRHGSELYVRSFNSMRRSLAALEQRLAELGLDRGRDPHGELRRHLDQRY